MGTSRFASRVESLSVVSIVQSAPHVAQHPSSSALALFAVLVEDVSWVALWQMRSISAAGTVVRTSTQP